MTFNCSDFSELVTNRLIYVVSIIVLECFIMNMVIYNYKNAKIMLHQVQASMKSLTFVDINNTRTKVTLLRIGWLNLLSLLLLTLMELEAYVCKHSQYFAGVNHI